MLRSATTVAEARFLANCGAVIAQGGFASELPVFRRAAQSSGGLGMDRLRMIQYFVTSARLGSFSRASRDLGVTPASVSRQVSLLEGRLGVCLFNRTTRHLSLTEGGALIFERVGGVMDQLSDAENVIRDLTAVPSGMLRVTAPASFGRLHVAPWLTGFLALYPEVKLDLLFTDRVVDLLEEKIDVAIRITAAQDSSTIGRKLAPQHSVVCASPDYVKRFGRPADFSALAGRNCLTYGTHPIGVWRLYRQGQEDEIACVKVRETCMRATATASMSRPQWGLASPCSRSGGRRRTCEAEPS